MHGSAPAAISTTAADLYDIAFSWDVEDEVDWLVARLGASCDPVLEPGCGAGRLLAAIAARGIGVTGIDSAPEMVELARRRLARHENATAVLGDMTSFALEGTF